MNAHIIETKFGILHKVQNVTLVNYENMFNMN